MICNGKGLYEYINKDIEEVDTMSEFNVSKMEELAKQDSLIKKMVNDLENRNPLSSREEILEVIYNSEVLGDSEMKRVYNSIENDGEPKRQETIYESAADTAKKIRNALKKAFPELPARHFSVTSDTYSGGSSVSVRWKDFPLESDVRKITDQYSSASFDGMQDLETLHGYIDPEDGKPYSGAKYVQTSYQISDERREKIYQYMENKYGDFKREHAHAFEWVHPFNEINTYLDLNNELLPEYDAQKHQEKVQKGLTDEEITGELDASMQRVLENTDVYLFDISPLALSTLTRLKEKGGIVTIDGLYSSIFTEDIYKNIVKDPENIQRTEELCRYADTKSNFEQSMDREILPKLREFISLANYKANAERNLQEQFRDYWSEARVKLQQEIQESGNFDLEKTDFYKEAWDKSVNKFTLEEIAGDVPLNKVSLDKTLPEVIKKKLEKAREEVNAQRSEVNKERGQESLSNKEEAVLTEVLKNATVSVLRKESVHQLNTLPLLASVLYPLETREGNVYFKTRNENGDTADIIKDLLEYYKETDSMISHLGKVVRNAERKRDIVQELVEPIKEFMHYTGMHTDNTMMSPLEESYQDAFGYFMDSPAYREGNISDELKTEIKTKADILTPLEEIYKVLDKDAINFEKEFEKMMKEKVERDNKGEPKRKNLTKEDKAEIKKKFEEYSSVHGVPVKVLHKAIPQKEVRELKAKYPDEYMMMVDEQIQAFAVAQKVRRQENNEGKENQANYHVKFRDLTTGKQYKLEISKKEEREINLEKLGELFTENTGIKDFETKIWKFGESEPKYKSEEESVEDFAKRRDEARKKQLEESFYEIKIKDLKTDTEYRTTEPVSRGKQEEVLNRIEEHFKKQSGITDLVSKIWLQSEEEPEYDYNGILKEVDSTKELQKAIERELLKADLSNLTKPLVASVIGPVSRPNNDGAYNFLAVNKDMRETIIPSVITTKNASEAKELIKTSNDLQEYREKLDAVAIDMVTDYFSTGELEIELLGRFSKLYHKEWENVHAVMKTNKIGDNDLLEQVQLKSTEEVDLNNIDGNVDLNSRNVKEELRKMAEAFLNSSSSRYKNNNISQDKKSMDDIIQEVIDKKVERFYFNDEVLSPLEASLAGKVHKYSQKYSLELKDEERKTFLSQLLRKTFLQGEKSLRDLIEKSYKENSKLDFKQQLYKRMDSFVDEYVKVSLSPSLEKQLRKHYVTNWDKIYNELIKVDQVTPEIVEEIKGFQKDDLIINKIFLDLEANSTNIEEQLEKMRKKKVKEYTDKLKLQVNENNKGTSNKTEKPKSKWSKSEKLGLVFKVVQLKGGITGIAAFNLKTQNAEVFIENNIISFRDYTEEERKGKRSANVAIGDFDKLAGLLKTKDLEQLKQVAKQVGNKEEDEQPKTDSNELSNEELFKQSPVEEITFNNKNEMLEMVTKALISGEVNLVFTKANGTERFMRATRNPHYFANHESLVTDFEKLNASIGTEINNGTIGVVDLDVEGGAGARKFVGERLVSFQPNKEGRVIKVAYKMLDSAADHNHFDPTKLKTKELIEILNEKVVRLVFEKKDGSTRPMVATRTPQLVELYTNLDKNGKRPVSRTDNNDPAQIQAQIEKDYVTVLDLEKGEFRTFKPSKLMNYDTDNNISSWLEFNVNNDAWFNVAKNGQDPVQYYKGTRTAENIGRSLSERAEYEKHRKVDNENEQAAKETLAKALEQAQSKKEEEALKAERLKKIKEIIKAFLEEYKKKPTTARSEKLYDSMKNIPGQLTNHKYFNNMNCEVQQQITKDETQLVAIKVNMKDFFYIHPLFIINAYSGRIYADKTPDKIFEGLGKVFKSDADTGSEDVLEKYANLVNGQRRLKSELYRLDETTEKRRKRLRTVVQENQEQFSKLGYKLDIVSSLDNTVKLAKLEHKGYTFLLDPDAIIQVKGDKSRILFKCTNPNARLTELADFFNQWINKVSGKTSNKETLDMIFIMKEILEISIDLRKRKAKISVTN